MAFSCKKDLGNYSYTTIDSLLVSGIAEDYLLKPNEVFQVTPQVKQFSGKSFDSNQYTFEWAAYKQVPSSSNEQKIVLSDQPNFNQVLPLSVGKYHIYYTIREKDSNITWTTKFNIEISSSFNGGWMILSENGENSQLDFYEYNHATANYPKVYRNFQTIFSDSKSGKKLSLEGKPKFITTWSNDPAVTGTGMTKDFIYIGTDKNTEKINLTDNFIWTDQYAFKYETMRADLFQTVDAIYPVDASRNGYVVKDNDVYLKIAVMSLAIGTPINRLSDGSYFKASPYIAAYSSFIPSCLIFDETNKRFVRNSSFSNICVTALPYDANNSPFNPNKVDMDLVWMNQTVALGGQAYAVLKNKNKFLLARMDNNMGFSVRYLDEITSLPGIAEASRFEVDTRYGYLQYVVGSKIYQYDPSEKSVKLMKDYGNRQITVFKYLRDRTVSYSTVINVKNAATFGQRFLPLTTGLVVATYDPSTPAASGKVDVLEIPQFNAAYKTFYSFEGFGKVADATEAPRPYGW